MRTLDGGEKPFESMIEFVVADPDAALRWTARGWVEPGPPENCPKGHRLRGPYRVLVGSQVCECGTIHRVFHCSTCDASVYRPDPGPECSFVDFDGRRQDP